MSPLCNLWIITLGKTGDSMTRLRTAVVGVGHLGQHHARILAGLPDVELVGVVDSNPEQARAVADRLGTAALDHFEPLLGRVDAVSVVTPTIFHHQVASAFLNAGTPVTARYEWDFGTDAIPRTASTTGNRATASYTSTGSKVITVRVIQASGPSGDGTTSIVVKP